MMPTVLEVKHLIKKFDGVHAIDRLSLAIEKGKITSIIGPNGSGKTTLMNVLSGLLGPESGVIIINGIKTSRVKPYDTRAYGLTRTFQEVRLFLQMSVLDNILLVLTERPVFSAFFENHGPLHLKQAQEVLERVGLWEKRQALAANLSYGQRKLLEIARVLAMKSDIILFDEPFAGLFPEMVKNICAIIEELKTQGKTIVLIEHNMSLIRELSDHVFVLDSGELLAEGTPEEVLSKRTVIDAYLGE